jgi:hypothetical protein
MIDTIDYITSIQLQLTAEIAREVEHGATQRDVFEAVAHTLTDVMHTPTSPSWVATFARSQPRNLAHGSIARIQSLKKMLDDNMSVWSAQ